MLRPNSASLLRTFAPLIAFWAFAGQNAVAAAPRLLVVVANPSDEDSVRRIGGNLVRVEVMFSEEGAKQANYDTCSERVQNLAEYNVLFFRAESACPVEQFWRDRMKIANPKGRLQRLSRPHRENVVERRISRVRTIHDTLHALLPGDREQLDANLQSEICRLNSIKLAPLRLALRD